VEEAFPDPSWTHFLVKHVQGGSVIELHTIHGKVCYAKPKKSGKTGQAAQTVKADNVHLSCDGDSGQWADHMSSRELHIVYGAGRTVEICTSNLTMLSVPAVDGPILTEAPIELITDQKVFVYNKVNQAVRLEHGSWYTFETVFGTVLHAPFGRESGKIRCDGGQLPWSDDQDMATSEFQVIHVDGSDLVELRTRDQKSVYAAGSMSTIQVTGDVFDRYLAGDKFKVSVSLLGPDGVVIETDSETIVSVSLLPGNDLRNLNRDSKTPEGVKGCLGGEVRCQASKGVALFKDLYIEGAGADYKLAFDADGLKTTSSSSFRVAPGAPVKLHLLDDWMEETPCVIERFGIGNPICKKVQALDRYGNFCRMQDDSIDSGPEIIIEPALISPSGVIDPKLSGATRMKTFNGMASFTDLSVNPAGEGYQIRFDAIMPDSGEAGEDGEEVELDDEEVYTAKFDVVPGHGSSIKPSKVIPKDTEESAGDGRYKAGENLEVSCAVMGPDGGLRTDDNATSIKA